MNRNSRLHLETAYFGDRRRNTVVLAIYDKKKEQLERKNSCYPGNTRCELRLFASDKNPENEKTMRILMASITLPDEILGSLIRQTIFTGLLFSQVHFTKVTSNHKRKDFKDPFAWSNWYKELFLACAYPLTQKPFIDLLKASSLTGFFNELEKIKDNPENVYLLFREDVLSYLLSPRAIMQLQPRNQVLQLHLQSQTFSGFKRMKKFSDAMAVAKGKAEKNIGGHPWLSSQMMTLSNGKL